jgi:hypothetical protein
MMSPLNTMEMVNLVNAEVQRERSRYQEPIPESRDGRLARILRMLLQPSKQADACGRLEPSAI